MVPYLIYAQNVSAEDLEDLEECRGFLNRLPEPEDREFITKIHIPAVPGQTPVWTCHGMTRAFQRYGGDRWEVADGWFGSRSQQHSWLWRREDTKNDSRVVILDVYPVSATGPILLDASNGSPWLSLYLDMPRAYSREQHADWEREAEHAIQKHISLFVN